MYPWAGIGWFRPLDSAFIFSLGRQRTVLDDLATRTLDFSGFAFANVTMGTFSGLGNLVYVQGLRHQTCGELYDGVLAHLFALADVGATCGCVDLCLWWRLDLCGSARQCSASPLCEAL